MHGGIERELFHSAFTEMEIGNREAFLRLSAILLLALTAFLVGFDTQTKLIFSSISRKATFRDVNAFVALVWIDSLAAGYNLLQVFRCYLSFPFKGDLMGFIHTSCLGLFLIRSGGGLHCICSELCCTGGFTSSSNWHEKLSMDRVVQQIHQVLHPNWWGFAMWLCCISLDGGHIVHLGL
ncbi:hypothetical protein F0562_030579 [Nyssa sinensis]|uniref:CASP-like protein n=1 Tax=Nyssa sinensis TaxID=561372 RepID=A0A5J5B073_9ASTE|nr:hypothetical protein F0562_030579 [Nyssa sinensis]